MNLTILDTNFNAIKVFDNYESFIWTDRYFSCGDFELYTAVSIEILEYFKNDYYIVNRDSDHIMIIESIKISSDPEDGNKLIVTGRSLEALIDRRIIWEQTILRGNLQNAIEKLLNDSIISPRDSKRKISNFIFERSDDPYITGLSISAQYAGDNLYDVICELAELYQFGWKITLNDNNQFVFKLYSGVDRSYEQTTNPYVVFSPKFDNITNSNYIESKNSYKTVTLIGGEGSGASRIYTSTNVKDYSGLNRREIFTDASGVASSSIYGKNENDSLVYEYVNNEDNLKIYSKEITSQTRVLTYTYEIQSSEGEVICDNNNESIIAVSKILVADVYLELLQQKGQEELLKNKEIKTFDGEAETSSMYIYGIDFFEGDIVQVADIYNHSVTSRIVEVVISENNEGRRMYPTFQAIT